MAKKEKIEKVTKPYLKGAIFDRTSPMGALRVFGGTVAMTFGYTLVFMFLSFDQKWLTITISLFIALAMYLMFFQFGMTTGASAVNQGEIMFSRQQKDRPVAPWERELCYHPFKGMLYALLGSLPLIVCSIVFACIAQRQMTSLGVLPSWLGGFESRQEIGGALAVYHQSESLSLEAVLRIIVRMSTMPFVSIIGAENKDAMLTLERCTPLLNMLPAIWYGLGYMNGVSVRTAEHTNIALGKKKLKRKQAKERRARRQAHGPEQLN